MRLFPVVLSLVLTITSTIWVSCTPKGAQLIAQKGNAALQSGPMLGYVDMREALIWVQSKGASEVVVEYWESGKRNPSWKTDPVLTQKNAGYTAKCIADRVEPGKQYDYQVLINGQAVKLNYPCTFKTQTLWQWRTDPPKLTIATGSCFYVNEEVYDRPGKGYGSEYGIFQKLQEKKPDVMVWLGDNYYFREPDWYTRTGMIHRATHTRSLPELQPFLASTAQYAIWDDHDYGPNDSDGSFVQKEMAWEVFQHFWGNPGFGIPGQKGCTTLFQYGDMDFFLLDNRYFRTPNHCKHCPNRSLLGEAQLNWLFQSLASSMAPFKFIAIGGQVITTNDNSETCFHFFPEERQLILDFIEKQNIKGVVFLTGDRHFAELSAMKNKAGNWVYDLTSSSLTAGSYTGAAKEQNDWRVPGTLFDKHNFALIQVSGPRKERQLELQLYDTQGNNVWTKTIGSDGVLKQ